MKQKIRFNLQNNNGITLTALVITVVIMVILVSVGINVSSSMQDAMQLEQFKTKLEIMQTEAVEKYGEATTSAYVQDNLKLQLDGIDNTGNGHNNSTDIWYDLSGNGIDGTIKNGATWNEEGNGLYFDGTDDRVALDEMNYEKVTIEAVIEHSNVNKAGEVDIFSNFESGGYGLVYTTSRGNYFAACINYGENWKRTNMKINTIQNSIKYNLSGQYNGKECILFENMAKNVGDNENGVLFKPAANTIMALGVNPSRNYATGGHFNGTIYAARIYDRALTDEEVEHNYYLDQIRFNIGADEEGYVHYTPEELTKLGFSNAEQDAYINWSTRQVKMYYNGEEYTSDKYLPQTNVDNSAEINFDINMVYEDGRYKVKVIPEENKAGLSVTYKKEDSDTWLHADGYSFEYADYGTTEVKLSDQNGNESIKSITQTQETVTTTGEIATLDGTLGEKVVSCTVTNPEVNSNITVIGRNVIKGFSTPSTDNTYWDSAGQFAYLTPLTDGWGHFEADNTEGTSTRWINAYIRNSYKKMFKQNTKYTLLYEIRNNYESGAIALGTSHGNYTLNDIFNIINIGNKPFVSTNENEVQRYVAVTTSGDTFQNTEKCLRTLVYTGAGGKINVDIRFWIYEGEQTENLEYEPYTETNYTIENTSSLPDITTKKGITHILVENTSEEQLAASYTYIKTVID